jgi:DNA-binding beta-propeller fold protein YncE
MGYDEAPFYGFVTVLSDTQRVKTIVGPTRPTAMALNPANGDVYVTYKLCYHCDVFGYFTTTMLALNNAEISDVLNIDGDASAVVVNPSNNYVYIAAHRYESEPSVVILNNIYHIATVRGCTPKVVEVNPISGRVYVVDPAHRSVAVIEDGRIVADVEVDMIPSNLAVNPTTGLVYVTGYLPYTWTGTVAILSDIQVIAQLNVGIGVAGVEVAPGHDYIYVAQYGGSVIVLSGTQVITAVAVGAYTSTLMLRANPYNGYIYAGSSNGISVLSGTQVITRISTCGCDDVRFIDVNPATGYVYAVNAERLDNESKVSNVWVVSGMEVITQATLEGWPTAFSVNPANDYAYIATDNERVSMLSGGQVVTTFSTAAQTTAIAVSHASDYVYVAHQNDMVSVLSGTQVVTMLPAGDYPYDIAINPTTGWVYVVNHYGQSVTVIADVPAPLSLVYLPLVMRNVGAPTVLGQFWNGYQP